jgi:predicted Zn-dependent peptidase
LFSFPQVTDYELQIVKNKYETGILYDTESIINLGNIAINYILVHKDPELYRNIRQRIQRIKAKHVNNFASKVFKKENLSIFIGCRKDIYEELTIDY